MRIDRPREDQETLDDMFCIDIWVIILEYMTVGEIPSPFQWDGEERQEDNLFLEACEEGNVEVVDFLTRKTDVHIRGCRDMAFVIASYNRHFEVMRYLIDLGADVSMCDNYAYQNACSHGHLDVVKFLNENGVDVLEEKYFIQDAFACNQQKVIRYLNGRGVSLDTIFDYSESESFGT